MSKFPATSLRCRATADWQSKLGHPEDERLRSCTRTFKHSDHSVKYTSGVILDSVWNNAHLLALTGYASVSMSFSCDKKAFRIIPFLVLHLNLSSCSAMLLGNSSSYHIGSLAWTLFQHHIQHSWCLSFRSLTSFPAATHQSHRRKNARIWIQYLRLTWVFLDFHDREWAHWSDYYSSHGLS